MKLILMYAVSILVGSALIIWLVRIAVGVIETLAVDGRFDKMLNRFEAFNERVVDAIVRLIERKGK